MSHSTACEIGYRHIKHHLCPTNDTKDCSKSEYYFLSNYIIKVPLTIYRLNNNKCGAGEKYIY